MPKLDKVFLLKQMIAQFEREIAEQTQSAKAAHEAATHEESKAEDRHDTFAIEASYLAAGQSARIFDLERVLSEFRSYADQSSKVHTRVTEGALVVFRHGSKETCAFFAKSGGGNQLKIDGLEVSVVTNESPLGDALLDAEQGDEIEVESKNGIRTYQVISVQ